MELRTKLIGGGEIVENIADETPTSKNRLPEEPRRPNGKKTGWMSEASLWLGVASIILWGFSIVPILAIISGVAGLSQKENRWKAAVGLTLGIVFLIVRIFTGTNPFLAI